MNNKWQGFTLIEMLLVLLVMSVFIAFPIVQRKKWQEKQDAAYFFYELEYQLFLTQESAIYAHKPARVTPIIANKEIVFSYYNQRGQKIERVLSLPESIRLVNQMTIVFSPGSGTINKISSIEFKSDFKSDKIIYQYYIGSGRFVKKG